MAGYRRAINLDKPSNRAAVRSANKAVPDPKTPVQKKQWMDAYIAAGGEYKEVKKRGCKPGDTKSPCPCKSISSITIQSITYLSDHDKLKNHTTDWLDGGARYGKPEWTSASQHPVSHNMNKPVKIKVKFIVKPADACPKTGTLKGSGPHGLVFKKSGYTFKAGTHELPLDSGTGKVANKTKSSDRGIQKLDFKIDWQATGTGVSVTPTSTKNEMFISYDIPFGSVVTYKRLAWAVNRCKTKYKIDDIVLKAHEWINTNTPPKFNVATNEWPTGTPPIWRMLESGFSGGSCIAHSNFLKHVVNILGVPNGTLERVYSSTDTNFSSAETWSVAGRTVRPVVVVVRSGGSYEWNWFEACLKINSKWYAGALGTTSHSSALAVHRAYATSNKLVYITIDAGPRRFFDKNGTSYLHGSSIPSSKCIPVLP